MDRDALEDDLAQRPTLVVDGHLLHHVKRRVGAIDHPPDDGVLAVQGRLLGVRDEELKKCTITMSWARAGGDRFERGPTWDLFVSRPELAIATIPLALNLRRRRSARGLYRGSGRDANLERGPDLIRERPVPDRLPALARARRIPGLNHEVLDISVSRVEISGVTLKAREGAHRWNRQPS